VFTGAEGYHEFDPNSWTRRSPMKRKTRVLLYITIEMVTFISY